jgi:alkylation response protein AidB-like acyl-CoA dehydrogenase
MNLALTADQAMIRDAAASFLADASSSAAVRKAMESEGGFDPGVWQKIGGELGWCGTAVPEKYGGLGLGPVELALIVEQMGRHLLCAPFFSSVCLAATALAEAGRDDAQQKYLPRIASGDLQATASLEDAGLRARKAKDGWRLTGTIPNLVDAATAERLFIVARAGNAEALFVVARNAPGLAATTLKGWDGTRRFARVALRNVAAERVDAPSRRHGIDGARALARLYLAAEQLGGAQQCLDLALKHVLERKQFGRAIASFQAIKHRCAAMMVQVEALRSAVCGAAALAASRPAFADVDRECAMVKALASDVYFLCAQEAIQLHGGVGFTWEFDPQLYFKRAQASSHWLGSASVLRERVAAGLLD